MKKEKGRVKTISRIQRRRQVKEISRGRKNIHFFECFQGQLAELKAEAESQLILLDLSVSIDVTVTHQGFPELIQVCPTDAGLQKEFIAVKVLVDLNASNKSLYRLLKQRKVYLKKVPTLLCKFFLMLQNNCIFVSDIKNHTTTETFRRNNSTKQKHCCRDRKSKSYTFTSSIISLTNPSTSGPSSAPVLLYTHVA